MLAYWDWLGWIKPVQSSQYEKILILWNRSKFLENLKIYPLEAAFPNDVRQTVEEEEGKDGEEDSLKLIYLKMTERSRNEAYILEMDGGYGCFGKEMESRVEDIKMIIVRSHLSRAGIF